MVELFGGGGLPIMRKTGFWTRFGVALGPLFAEEGAETSLTASTDAGFGVSAIV